MVLRWLLWMRWIDLHQLWHQRESMFTMPGDKRYWSTGRIAVRWWTWFWRESPLIWINWHVHTILFRYLDFGKFICVNCINYKSSLCIICFFRCKKKKQQPKILQKKQSYFYSKNNNLKRKLCEINDDIQEEECIMVFFYCV